MPTLMINVWIDGRYYGPDHGGDAELPPELVDRVPVEAWSTPPAPLDRAAADAPARPPAARRRRRSASALAADLAGKVEP